MKPIYEVLEQLYKKILLGICLFQNSDKLLSHMASECLALLLYFQVREKVTLSNSWITFCQQNLSEYFENDKVVCCLWTLTAVIKEIFKDTCLQKPEILKQFLTPFNTTFEAFYNSLFSQRFENCQETSKLINSLVCFLELLELLTASGIYLELQFTCQRLFFLNPSLLLDVPTWPAPAFIRRKFIIFIKKCFLFKVGEDLFRGCVPISVPPPQDLLGMDMLALANAVLQAVSFGWLKAVLSVHGKPSCFGGDAIHPGCENNSAPDYVILRATTLVLLKSLEIKFQNFTAPNEIQGNSLKSFLAGEGCWLRLAWPALRTPRARALLAAVGLRGVLAPPPPATPPRMHRCAQRPPPARSSASACGPEEKVGLSARRPALRPEL
ncbi:PREDICTED: protein Lines homolog [Chrysochloris asiatica]|uniref:Protein Lines homolog n=1 Tax=Chrysochloris asiatica TaxID=185453 RepID=A0A9B0TY28_CHRAS|nr:PREDICTED: protein Lines homolog [Chrysochloris asiatica]